MGGLDKGLQPWHGKPLAQHAMARLAAQTGPVLISANRHLDRYAALGAPVVGDTRAEFAGPLAGLLAGLDMCTTPWLAAVPCDAPWFPPDLVQRLAGAAQQASAQAAVAATTSADGSTRWQPVFCLVHVALRPSLARWLDTGGRKAGDWFAAQNAACALYDEGPETDRAFMNINTLAELARAAER